MAAKKTSDTGPTIVIPRIKRNIIKVPIQGISPLVVHSWDEKAKRMMRDKQLKRATAAKDAKDPYTDFVASKYTSDEGWEGVPSVSFKAAMVDACRAVSGLAMTVAKRMFFVIPDGKRTTVIEELIFEGSPVVQTMDLTRIKGKPMMREDMVRLETGVADLRYRAAYMEWEAVVTVEVNTNKISVVQAVNLLENAGYSEGICEWRPGSPKSNTGTWGRFEVVRE